MNELEIDDVLHEFIWGIRNGYSQCCVIWYCTAWGELWEWFLVRDSSGVIKSMEYNFIYGYGENHILCPDCTCKKVMGINNE